MDYKDIIRDKRLAKGKDLEDIDGQIQHAVELSRVLDTISTVGSIVSGAIDKKSNDVKVLNFPTSISTPDIEKLAIEIKELRDKLLAKEPDNTVTHKLLEDLIKAIDLLPKSAPKDITFPKSFSVDNQKDYSDKIENVVKAVQAIKLDFQPNITVKPADVKVEKTDFTILEDKFDVLTAAVKAMSIVIPEHDDTEMLDRISATTKAINSLSFPVPNYVLPYKNTDGAAVQVNLTADGKIPVDSSTLNALITTMQKTVLSWDKIHKILQETRDATAMPVYYDEPSNANRTLPSGGTVGTVTTVTTVGTVSNQTNIGGQSADTMMESTSYQDWGLAIRSNLL